MYGSEIDEGETLPPQALVTSLEKILSVWSFLCWTDIHRLAVVNEVVFSFHVFGSVHTASSHLQEITSMSRLFHSHLLLWYQFIFFFLSPITTFLFLRVRLRSLRLVFSSIVFLCLPPTHPHLLRFTWPISPLKVFLWPLPWVPRVWGWQFSHIISFFWRMLKVEREPPLLLSFSPCTFTRLLYILIIKRSTLFTPRDMICVGCCMYE